jgi:hypothetical protein
MIAPYVGPHGSRADNREAVSGAPAPEQFIVDANDSLRLYWLPALTAAAGCPPEEPGAPRVGDRQQTE